MHAEYCCKARNLPYTLRMKNRGRKRKMPALLELHEPVVAAATELKQIRSALGVSQQIMARLIGVSTRLLAGIENGTHAVSDDVNRGATEFRRLYTALIEAGLEPPELGKWLITENKGFSGARPIEVIEHGESDRIWRMLYHLNQGMPA
jgi:transcriptional regulator with XRE-family HTH domain